MRQRETLGLIIMMYDYKPDFEGIKQKDNCSIIVLEHFIHEYLQRRGYFDKREGRPTKKLYKLLHKYGVSIKQLKSYQDEYEATGHVTQYDKFGNKQVL